MLIKLCKSELSIKPADSNSLMCSIIICFSLINGAIGINKISYITIGIVIAIFSYGVIRRKCRLYAKDFLLVLVIVVAFLFSFLIVSNTTYTLLYFLYFIGFSIVSFFAGLQDYDIWKTIKYCEIIGFIGCVVYFFRGVDNYDPSLQMGISYSLLPVFLFSILIVFNKAHRSIISIANLIMTGILYVAIAPRGVWLSVGMFSILVFYRRFSTNREGRVNTIRQFIVLAILFVALVFIYTYIMHIVGAIQTLYSSITGNRIYALDKMAFLMAQGNLGNGRQDLASFAIKLIKEAPLWGHGIGFFESFQDGYYVHEIWLQALCEFGLFSFVPMLVFFIYCLTLVFKNKSGAVIEVYYFFVLFVNGFVILFYSSVYWKLLLFWFLLGFVIKEKRVKK